MSSNNSAVRKDSGKLRYDLLPPEALQEVVRVYTIGADKYAPRNWELGMDWSRCYASLLRHTQAFWMGEDLDPESGLPHPAHMAWNAIALLQYMLKEDGHDDRPGNQDGKMNYEEGGDLLISPTEEFCQKYKYSRIHDPRTDPEVIRKTGGNADNED